MTAPERSQRMTASKLTAVAADVVGLVVRRVVGPRQPARARKVRTPAQVFPLTVPL